MSASMFQTWLLIALLAGFSAASSSPAKRTFENYKVFRIVPSSNEHLQVLRKMQTDNEDYSYWIEPKRVFQAVDLMVSPSKQPEFAKLMEAADMRYATYVDNVQRLIERENVASSVQDAAAAGLDWTHYHPLERINAWLHNISVAYPNKVKVVDAGRSFEGRPIRGVKLSFGGGVDRPAVFLEGGIHAREWISPATLTYLINAFLTSEQPEVRQLADAYDWHIFPVLNPDGYVYTHKTDRTWRKTRSTSNQTRCFGADPNRNWGFKWMHGGASSDPCVDTYAGSRAFSEIETASMSQYISSIAKREQLFGYIAFHCYAQVLMFPYGYTGEHLDNYDQSKSIALKSVEALSQRYGTEYRTGSIYETMYLSSGSSLEWVKGTLRLPLTFAYELRDQGKYGFILPAEQILPNCEEVLDSLITMFAEAAKLGYHTRAATASASAAHRQQL